VLRGVFIRNPHDAPLEEPSKPRPIALDSFVFSNARDHRFNTGTAAMLTLDFTWFIPHHNFNG
jgi:hypothetical protein